MKIIVNKNEFSKVVIEVLSEMERTGAQGIEVNIKNNKLTLSIIESGGFGCCDDFDIISGLTEEEILDLP